MSDVMDRTLSLIGGPFCGMEVPEPETEFFSMTGAYTNANELGRDDVTLYVYRKHTPGKFPGLRGHSQMPCAIYHHWEARDEPA